jgi:hypothetical protein
MKRTFTAVVVRLSFALVAALAVCASGVAEKAYAAQQGMGLSAPAAQTMTGTVVETMNSGGYTYVCLEEKGKKTWFAAPEMKIAKGQVLTFELGMEMKNFTSKTLNRTFDTIYFSTGPVTAQQAGAGTTAPEAQAAKNAAPADGGEKISVKKASGKNAYTVAEVFEKRELLNKKTARVRAKVVKVSEGIMGKNWIHLQDGTGDAAKRTNDLIATTAMDVTSPAVGAVVTVSGTVYKDKDFGSGYKYAAIIEEAKVRR